jgi:monoamine oxidase
MAVFGRKQTLKNTGEARQRPILAQPIDKRIFFAGEATTSVAFASVHGACISGRDAARATVAWETGYIPRRSIM